MRPRPGQCEHIPGVRAEDVQRERPWRLPVYGRASCLPLATGALCLGSLSWR